MSKYTSHLHAPTDSTFYTGIKNLYNRAQPLILILFNVNSQVRK